ncbi:MAG TPA: Ig-like domain-containing protein [Jatrophihabitans sp.]|nr:Ig-like domain-containing protein [Jatrophihabitans sp.]
MREFGGVTCRMTGRRGVALGVTAAGAVALLALTACTSGGASTVNSPVAHGSGLPAEGPTSAGGSSTPAAPAALITTPVAGRRINPASPVTVGIQNGRLTGVTMVNAQGKHVRGAISTDGKSWHNTEDLGYSKTYTISAAGVAGDGSSVHKTAKVTTLTPNNMTMPYIEDIYGSYLNNNGSYGVGMVFRVHFDEQVNEAKAERALQVTTSPNVTGSWYWADSQNAYWRPQNYYAPGTKVTVSANVYGKDVGQGLYGQADQSVSFKIGAKHYSVADAKTHQVKVYFDDKLVRTMATSMGRGGTVQGRWGPIYLWTMPGVYTVINHENPATMSSDSYGLPANSPVGYAPEQVPWATKISVDGIYLHELDATVWAQGHQNLSHGCLNLNYTNAKWYYQHSLIGDVVQVVHSGGPKINFNQGGEWSVPWSQWVKGSALH